MKINGTWLVRQPNGGRIVEVSDEKQQEYWINKGFKDVTKQEALAYLSERKMRLSASTLANSGYKLDVYFRTADKRGDGYGMSGQHLKEALKEHGIYLNNTYNKQQIGLLYHSPSSVTSIQTDIKVIYTMFESTKTPRPQSKKGEEGPSDWKEYCEFADKVLVPSKFAKEVFAYDDIDTEVVPLGYNAEMFRFHQRHYPKKGEPFVFLNLEAFDPRKGFSELWEAWNNEFDGDENVKLVLKTRRDHPPIPITKSNYPNVEVVTGDIAEQDLLQLYKDAHCFVFPSRGEGFGIPPLEAMATGLPTLVPNAHGISQYFKKDFMYEVKVAGETPAEYSTYKGLDTGNMTYCDVKDLQKQMRYVYENHAESMTKGFAASTYVTKYSYKNTAKKLAKVLFELEKNPPKKRGNTDILDVETI